MMFEKPAIPGLSVPYWVTITAMCVIMINTENPGTVLHFLCHNFLQMNDLLVQSKVILSGRF